MVGGGRFDPQRQKISSGKPFAKVRTPHGTFAPQPVQNFHSGSSARPQFEQNFAFGGACFSGGGGAGGSASGGGDFFSSAAGAGGACFGSASAGGGAFFAGAGAGGGTGTTETGTEAAAETEPGTAEDALPAEEQDQVDQGRV